MTITPHPLAHEPLAFLAFEKIRRVGVDSADGQIITHEGIEYGLTVHTISTITTVHVVLEALNGPATGHQRAIGIVSVQENGYTCGPGGLDLVFRALYEGIRVHGHPHITHDYRVLPFLPVPPAFQATKDDSEQAPA